MTSVRSLEHAMPHQHASQTAARTHLCLELLKQRVHKLSSSLLKLWQLRIQTVHQRASQGANS